MFIKGGGCWSYVGRVGGKQQISFGNGCVHEKTIQHEVIHALGRIKIKQDEMFVVLSLDHDK